MAVNMDWGVTQRSFLGESPASGAASTPHGGTPDPTQKDVVIQAIDAAIQHGIYVIVDWHAYFGDTRFPNPPPLQATIDFFLEMSDRYPNVPNIIWETLNEPIGPNTVEAWWGNTLKPWKQTVTDAIRGNGDDRIIIIGTPRWCQRPDVAAANPIDGTNLVYSMHFYAGGNTDHNTVGRRRIITTMMQHRLPVFISEFGLTGPDGGQPPSTGIRADSTDVWMDFLNQYNIGYANWALNSDRQGSAAMTAGVGGTPSGWTLSASGTYMRNELRRTEPRTRRFYSIDVQRWGRGTVNVTAGNLGPYAAGTNHSATLQAVPASGETFVGWTVNGQPPPNPTNLTLALTGSWAGGSTDMVVVAEFSGGSSSTLPASARHSAAQWSVRRTGNGLTITAPPSGNRAEVMVYDIRGKVVRRLPVDGRTAAVNSIRVPAGSYIVAVRDRSSGREIYRTRVSTVN
jgi:hypothetical protein